MLKNKAKVFSILRGFKVLKNNNKLGLWESVRFDLQKINPLGNKYISKFFFGNSFENARVAIHQYCIDRMIKLWLGKKIIIQVKDHNYKIIWPSTRIWLSVFEKRGINMNFFFSRLSWAEKVLIIYCYNIINCYILLYKINPFKENKYLTLKFSYFDKIFINNIPKDSSDDNYTLINWFLNSNLMDSDIGGLFHNIKSSQNLNINNITIGYRPLPYEMPLRWKEYIEFVIWFVKALLLTTSDIIRLRWHHPIMLLEAARLKVVELTEEKNLACDYYFHWSGGLYRPLWTYGAHQRGCGVNLYFYSVIEAPTLKERTYSHKSQYWLLNWPLYICWNQRHADNIKNNNFTESNIVLGGPLWFGDSGLISNNIISDYIAVFCVEYFRKSFYIGLSSLNDYFEKNPNLSSLFLTDIEYCCSKLGLKMLHKRKRNEGRRALKKYIMTINNLSAGKTYIQADPSESTIRLIKSSKYVICFPFTSVALQAEDMGKKVVYYDPLFWIDKNDPASNGIPIIQGKNQLLEWFSKN